MAGAYALATYRLGGYGLCANQKLVLPMPRCVRTIAGMACGQTLEGVIRATNALRNLLEPGQELQQGGHSLGWGLTQKQIQSKVIDAGGFPVRV